jgi:cytochrome P450
MQETALPEVNILSPEFQHDPFAVLAQYRRERPVFQATDLPVFMLTRYEDVAGMRDMSLYSTKFIRELRAAVDGPNMIQMDGEEHRQNRTLVSHAWRPKMIRELVQREVPGMVDDLLRVLRPRGKAELMHDFCEPLPFRTITLALMGMTIEDQPRMSQIYRDLVAVDPVQYTPERVATNMRAREEMLTLLNPILEDRRARPTDDFISQLAAATTPDGARLSDQEILGFLLFLLPAGQDTTMSALGTLVLRILQDQTVRDALHADPSLIPAAIEESIRMRPPITYINRVTLKEQTLHGVTIPEGVLVLGSMGAANRDESVFDDPNTFRLDRDPNPHLSFGTGAHMCIGAQLARLEIETALPALLEGLPNLRLAPGFEPRFQNLFNTMLHDLPVEFDAV